MKKYRFKDLVLAIIIGGIVFGGIGVTAVTLTADQVKYTPNNDKFTATNIKEAVDEIYKLAEYEIPADTYFYEEGTEGDSTTIVRYKKINGDYYVCDEKGIVAQDTTVTDITGKNLIPYTGIRAENVSAGMAGYASGSLILGDGTDNKTLNGIELQSVTRNFTITVGNSSLSPSVSIAGTFDHILGITYVYAQHKDTGDYRGYHFSYASFNSTNNTITFNYLNWGAINGSWSRSASVTIIGYND